MDILSEDELKTQFPKFSDKYDAVLSAYENVLNEIQNSYDTVKKECGANWNDPKVFARMIKEKGGFRGGLVFKVTIFW